MASSSDVVSAWRIVKGAHVRNAFDGEGARIHGGRWNSPGFRAVYTAQNRALAALELLVHLQSAAALSAFWIIECRFPSRFVTTASPAPDGWRKSPVPPNVQQYGDAWIRRATSAVLAVPSTVVFGEWNYVLNPQHPDFAAIEIDEARPFNFDLRLVR